MSWVSDLLNRLTGKEKSVAKQPEKPVPFKPGWPMRLTMDGIEYEIDRTQSEPMATLQDRVAKKAAKGIKLMSLREIAPGQVEVYWIRPVVVKPPAGSNTVAAQ